MSKRSIGGHVKSIASVNSIAVRCDEFVEVNFFKLSSEPGCEFLKQFVIKDDDDNFHIDWSNIEANKALTCCILRHFFKIEYWEIPDGYLCPPVPQRVNYVHFIYKLIGQIEGPSVVGIDVGIGANAIYSLLAASIYDWKMIGLDVDKTAIKNCENLINKNELIERISVILNDSVETIFPKTLHEIDVETFAFCMCNPPFYDDLNELNVNPNKEFGGMPNELVFPGGELKFIEKIIRESVHENLKNRVIWFTSLVARKSSIKKIHQILHDYCDKHNVKLEGWREVELSQGKQARWVVAWSFVSELHRTIRLEVLGRKIEGFLKW
jgi:23S rRNA (adenine1618-N6)-methyltransferase